MMERGDLSLVKKNPRGKFVGDRQKKIIVKLYKNLMYEQQNKEDGEQFRYVDIVKIISKASGIGRRTVGYALSEYKTKGTISSPNIPRKRKSVIDKSDDIGQNVIRQKVHSFWFNREIPTKDKILVAINKDENLPIFSKFTLHRNLKSLNYEYLKKNRISVLIERNDIVCWRRKYLESIMHYRLSDRPIYYLGESWVDTIINSTGDASVRELPTGQKEPSGKGKRLIVLHIGSADGFVPGGLLSIELKKNTLDYHDKLNGDTFYDWFIKILPSLKENSVIVMNNASYNSVKKHPFPTMAWNKQQIIDWLENKGKIVQSSLIKPQLLEIANELKPVHDKYVIDEVARDHNKIVLRLPPYHSELNPIEMAWSRVKDHVLMNKTKFKLEDVHNLLRDAVEHVTSEMWTNFIEHVVKEENKFWTVDDLTDEIFDAETGGHPGDGTSDSDDENI